MKCVACKAEERGFSVADAVVLGMVVADLQHRGRRTWAGSLCDKHIFQMFKKKKQPDEYIGGLGI